MSPSDYVVLFTPDPVTPPALFKILLAETGEQMIGTSAERPVAGVEPVTLGAADVADMMALTDLTKPGPFSARAHELGTFLGIRIDGQLVAMAGERMKPANYTEITAVCVHPSHRGRGYGQMLLAAVSRQISARGEIPFLHVFTSNDSAIALYRRQGMEIRRRLHVTVLQRRIRRVGSGFRALPRFQSTAWSLRTSRPSLVVERHQPFVLKRKPDGRCDFGRQRLRRRIALGSNADVSRAVAADEIDLSRKDSSRQLAATGPS